jgi:hypothetical protein
LSGSPTIGSSAQPKRGKGLHVLLWELSDNKEAMTDTGLEVPDDPQQPWLCDYCAYMDVLKQVPDGWSAVQWWGVSVLGFDILTRN